MSLVADPVKRARATSTELQAARLAEQLEAELALNDDLPAGWEDKADEALGILADRHGGLDHLRDVDTAGQGKGGWTPGLSPGARRGRDTDTDAPERAHPSDGDPTPSQTAGGKGDPAGTARPATGSRRPNRGRGRSTRSRGGRARGRGSVIPSTSSLPGSASAGQLIAAVLGGTIVLTLAYVLLTNADVAPRGRSVIELGASGIASVFRALIAPVDPLAPRAAQATATAQPTPIPLAPLPDVLGRPLSATPVPVRPRSATRSPSLSKR